MDKNKKGGHYRLLFLFLFEGILYFLQAIRTKAGGVMLLNIAKSLWTQLNLKAPALAPFRTGKGFAATWADFGRNQGFLNLRIHSHP